MAGNELIPKYDSSCVTKSCEDYFPSDRIVHSEVQCIKYIFKVFEEQFLKTPMHRKLSFYHKNYLARQDLSCVNKSTHPQITRIQGLS